MLDDANMLETESADPLDLEAQLSLRARLDAPPSLSLSDAIRAAADETGSGTGWLSGFWRAMNGPGNLTASEFFYYRLFDPTFTDDARRRFVGKQAQQKMHRACCDPMWFAPALDKLFFLSAMQGAGIPVPETVAVFDPAGRRRHPRALTSPLALRELLDRPGTYPLFAKPIDGMYSVGTLAMTDGGDGRVHVSGAGRVGTGDVIDFMAAMGPSGYLLQRMLSPHPMLAEAFGGALASVRFLVLLGDGGPEIESAVVKIPAAGSVADNYWRPGNMLGALGTETGEITRVISGTGPELVEVPTHPDTGRSLVGLRLPEWRAATELCLRAAGMLTGLGTQSWDIALTRKGPVALEVNWGGDLNLHQLAHRRGALTSGFIAHLQRHRFRGKLPAG